MRPKFKLRPNTKRILLHDSHTAPDLDGEAAIAHLNHNGRKMGLIDCGYHYAVHRDGLFESLRDEGVYGAAAVGLDLDSIHVVLIGGKGLDGNAEDNFTDLQREGLFMLIGSIRQRYPALPLYGHDEAQRFRRKGDRCPALDMEELRYDYLVWKETGVV